VSGLLRPRQGRVLLDGERIDGLSPAAVLARGIVHVPQERSLFPLMTIWDNLLMGGHVLRDDALVRTRAAAIADEFAVVRDRRHDRAGELSGGQQKLVEIARALMLEPRLILMDEPSMGLDPRARRQVFDTIADLNRGGRTILLVEQNVRAGLAVADVGAVMDAGTVRLVGEGRQLLGDARLAELYLGGAAHG
jgi:branched-chain amino acid transport system ATP-binding protein